MLRRVSDLGLNEIIWTSEKGIWEQSKKEKEMTSTTMRSEDNNSLYDLTLRSQRVRTSPSGPCVWLSPWWRHWLQHIHTSHVRVFQTSWWSHDPPVDDIIMDVRACICVWIMNTFSIDKPLISLSFSFSFYNIFLYVHPHSPSLALSLSLSLSLCMRPQGRRDCLLLDKGSMCSQQIRA